MKKSEDADMQETSGLFLGSEPLEEVRHRRSYKLAGDKKDGDAGDDDATDSDETDSDTTDKADGGDDTGDSDGKD